VYCCPCRVGEATCSEGSLDIAPLIRLRQALYNFVLIDWLVDITSNLSLEGDQVTGRCGTSKLGGQVCSLENWLHAATLLYEWPTLTSAVTIIIAGGHWMACKNTILAQSHMLRKLVHETYAHVSDFNASFCTNLCGIELSSVWCKKLLQGNWHKKLVRCAFFLSRFLEHLLGITGSNFRRLKYQQRQDMVR